MCGGSRTGNLEILQKREIRKLNSGIYKNSLKLSCQEFKQTSCLEEQEFKKCSVLDIWHFHPLNNLNGCSRSCHWGTSLGPPLAALGYVDEDFMNQNLFTGGLFYVQSMVQSSSPLQCLQTPTDPCMNPLMY